MKYYTYLNHKISNRQERLTWKCLTLSENLPLFARCANVFEPYIDVE